MAMILDENGYVVGVGYNGAPSGLTHCIDGGCPRLNQGSAPGSSYDNCVSVHAEINALVNTSSRDSRMGGTLYVNGEPCYSCAKAVANSGISEVVYTSDPDYVYQDFKKVEDLFEAMDIRLSRVPWESLS